MTSRGERCSRHWSTTMALSRSSSEDEAFPFENSVAESEENDSFGGQPYRFEPMARVPRPDRAPALQSQRSERSDCDTTWCKCGCCQPMTDPVNRFCCHENQQIMQRVEDGQKETRCSFNCITLHPDFNSVCLNVNVLRVAYFSLRQLGHAIDGQHTDDETMCYTAYRQLIRWCYGWLGKIHRVPLPACAMHAIRSAFPSESGQYTGFKFVDRK